MQTEVAKIKAEIKQNRETVANIMNKFSKEEVLKDKNLQKLVKETKAIAIKNKRDITPHMQELFSVVN
jgi:CMP-2-keto-3-deoxyoctulosonic acid synthetase